jgi:Pyridine nucleotide-disulphide oxidoreductase/GMC oxidoreductase
MAPVAFHFSFLYPPRFSKEEGMTSDLYDVIVVGSGPAGVSVAFPLVQAGLKVLMVDGGREKNAKLPSKPYLEDRYQASDQWEWMVGKDFHALREKDSVSPKLRVPTHRYVFDKFITENRIETENFVAIGSLAKGGLANAWGCGVAGLSNEELQEYPFPKSSIDPSYEIVTRRIGVSGSNDDDLSDFFGIDAWAQPPIAMDELHQQMFDRYSLRKRKLADLGFRLGRSRIAVLSRDLGERRACEKSGNCLWGCHHSALYTSANDLATLVKYQNFYYKPGFIVDRVVKDVNGVSVEGKTDQKYTTISAKKVVLAAGTLATTRLALQALKIDTPVKVQSCPIAAFLLWLPGMLGAERTNTFGLGQLSFSLKLKDDISGFGSTFSTLGIPMAEFLRHLPLRKRYGIDLLSQLLSSCLVGNMFLPGHLSTATASLNADGALKINGGYCDRVSHLMAMAASHLRRSYWKLGAWLLPTSFTQGLPGGDIHYSCTLPMRHNPSLSETDVNGELAGLAGVHVVDGSCLPIQIEKSHTLTIMANADRIGQILAIQMKNSLR